MRRIESRYLYIIFGILVWSGLAYGQLSWQMIAVQYDQERLLSEKAGGSVCYSISKDVVIYPIDPNDSNVQLKDVKFQRWAKQQWVPMTVNLPVKLTSGKVSIPVEGLEKGFYRIVPPCVDENTESGDEYYFLVSSDWKREIMGICQNVKREISNHPKSHDIGASIVISHFDNLQGKTVQSTFLTGDIISRMGSANQARIQFDQGQIPSLSIGLNKLHFKRFQGADFADFVVRVPGNYDPSKKWPIYVHVDSMRSSAGKYGNLKANRGESCFHKNMIDLWWHSIPYKGVQLYKDLRWKDFQYLLEALCWQLNIDKDRLYLSSGCTNSIPAMGIAVNYPDIWAESFFWVGNSYRNLSGNILNMPFTYGNSSYGPEHEHGAYYNFAIKCFQYHQCVDMALLCQQEKWISAVQGCPEKIRKHSPSKINYTIEDLKNPTAYWVAIKGREDENYPANIEIDVNDQRIAVSRKNIDSYQLNLKQAPLDHSLPTTIIDNGEIINIDPQEFYSYSNEKYDHARFVKNSCLHGPIYDVFTDAYTVLYTHGDDEKQTKQIAAIAKKIAGTGPCIPEGKLSEQITQSHNLVVVGRADKSTLLSQVSKELPIKLEEGKIFFDGKTVSGDMGVAMVYPNPLNPQKYIALILAGSNLSLKNLTNIWENKLSDAKVDVAIFKVNANNQCEFIRFEKFNTVWNWHEQWNDTIASVSKDHPKWRWRQWVGYAIRSQMEAEVMISEEVLETNEIPNYASITQRDLNRIFINEWIVKIKLNGGELKKVLMQSMAKKSSKKVKDPIVDGISYIKGMAGDDCICVSDIEPDQYYTVALPYKAVNGSRIGMILKDYEIVGDGYTLPMLNEYLRSREAVELDYELEKMKLNIL